MRHGSAEFGIRAKGKELIMADHYATLGVPRSSSRAVIRAAYVQLMRIYHPDRNPAPSAAGKVREITAAYAVLRDADLRAQYDRDQLSPRRPIRPPITPRPPLAPAPNPPALSRWFALAAASVVILLFVPLFIPPLASLPSKDSQPEVSRPIRASQARAAATAAFKDDPCSSTAATREVERQLIGAAARMARQKGSKTLGSLSNSMRLHLKGPERNSSYAAGNPVSCIAAVALELAPGMVVSDVRPGLIGTIAYKIDWSNEHGRSSIKLKEAEQLVTFLASIASPAMHVAQAPQSPGAPQVKQPAPRFIPAATVTPPSPPRTLNESVRPAPPTKVQVSKAEPRIQAAEPSFSCNSALSPATRLVCSSPQLAALDRQLASLWGDTIARASSSERARLLQNDARFMARRDACSSEPCVRAAYATQIGEIRSVAASGRR